MRPEPANSAENRAHPLPASIPPGETGYFLLAKPDIGELSRKGKQKAIILIAVGLLTIFLPVINFDPPLQGQQRWSVFDVARRIPAPASTDTLAKTFPTILTIAFEQIYAFYGTLLAGLGVVLLFPYRKLLLGVCLVALACLVFPFRGVLGVLWLAAMNSIQSDRGGDLKTLWTIFAIEVAALAVVAWTDTTA